MAIVNKTRCQKRTQ